MFCVSLAVIFNKQLFQLHIKKLIGLFFLFTIQTFAQETNETKSLDSLERSISNTNGKEKLAAILKFCEKNVRSSARQIQEYTLEGIPLAEAFKDFNAKAELLRYQGISSYILGKMDNSVHYLNQSITLSESINDSVNLGKCYNNLGRYYFILGDFKVSRSQDSLSLKIAEKIDNPKMIYDAKRDIATSYLGQGMYSKALQLLNEALFFCNAYDLDCSSSMINRGIAIHNIGKPSEALGLFFDARKLFFEKGDFNTVAIAEHHIGYLLERAELNEEATYYYSSVKEFYEKSGNVNHLSAIYSNLGELMLKLNKLDEAENYLKKSLSYKKDNGIKTIGDPLHELGLVALQRKNYALAFTYFQDAQKAFEALEDKAYKDEIYNSFSRSYLGMKDFENAIKYALRSVELNKKSGIKRELALSYENLVRAYEGQKKFDLALQAKKELEAVNLDLNGAKELLDITKKVVVETLRKNEEKNSLEAQIMDKGDTSRSSTPFWVFSILAILLLASGFYYVRKLKKPLVKIGGKIEYLQEEEANSLLKTLSTVIENEKPYLQPELNLSGLAERIGTSDKKLSALLNQSLSTSFYDYINHYRVEAVKEKLALKEYEKYSLVGLAYSCGFNSKSSFYRAFRKETGISPTAYKAQNAS